MRLPVQIVDVALLAHQTGYVVIPPREGGKAPAADNWRGLTRDDQSETEIRRLYVDGGYTGLGLVCGQRSGGLEVLDFDDRAAFAEFAALCSAAGAAELLDKVKSGFFEETPHGYHLLWRCDEPAGNQKLARDVGGRKALIETRGEGGYIVVSPTERDGNYVLISGGLDRVAYLDHDEREQLLSVARLLDRGPAAPEPGPVSGSRPGDDYNARADWSELLTRHGWTVFRKIGGVTQWTRPGKATGCSGTTGHCGDKFYVWSSSTTLEPSKAHSKFAVYAHYEHRDDYAEAARALAALGYGEVRAEDVAEVAEIFDRPVAVRGELSGDLLAVPGFIGDFAQYVRDTAPRDQPVLAMAAGLAVMSNLCARKVKTRSGIRPNLYVCAIAPSGAGKNRPREVIHKLYAEIGQPNRVAITDATSDTALLRGLSREPASLGVWDEFADILQQMSASRGSGGVKATLATELLKIYSSADMRHYEGKAFAGQDSISIAYPSLSLYGTSTPEGMRSALTERLVSNGTVNRMLMFWARGYPAWRSPPETDIPADLRAQAEAWIRWSPGMGLLETPEAMLVDLSAEGLEVLNEYVAGREEALQAAAAAGDYPRAAKLARGNEMVFKCALLRRCSVWAPGAGRPEIGADDMTWAIRLVTETSEITEGEIGAGSSETRHGAAVQEIERKLRELPSGEYSSSALVRRHGLGALRRGMSKREWEEALSAICEANGYTILQRRGGTVLKVSR